MHIFLIDRDRWHEKKEFISNGSTQVSDPDSIQPFSVYGIKIRYFSVS